MGALDARWWQVAVDAGLVLLHWADARDRERIEAEGLVPWDELPGGHRQAHSVMAPRRGFVYLASPDWHPTVTEMVRDERGRRVEELLIMRVDLSGIAAERVVPDEDVATAVGGLLIDPRKFNLERVDDDEVGPDRRHESYGAWAEAVDLGAQPGITEAAVLVGRIAVRGRIGPEALRRARVDRFGVPLARQ